MCAGTAALALARHSLPADCAALPVVRSKKYDLNEREATIINKYRRMDKGIRSRWW